MVNGFPGQMSGPEVFEFLIDKARQASSIYQKANTMDLLEESFSLVLVS